jgi:ADP-ribose pyrophosphatase YjhB (NUDIX family)
MTMTMAPRRHPTQVALATVFQVRNGVLHVLAWQRAQKPADGAWALPGGYLLAGETLEQSIRRQLAEKVSLADVSHLEQLGSWSDPARHPDEWQLATAFLGLVPSDHDPELPEDTRWLPAGHLPRKIAFDHRAIITAGLERLRGKLSYTNIGFALAPNQFTIAELRDIYSAALGYTVHATNLQRVLERRGAIVEAGGTRAPTGRGGRPALLYRFSDPELTVTDEFAILRPSKQA